jgi:ATP-dependent exoDNAse (exonuclease V) beta subunit
MVLNEQDYCDLDGNLYRMDRVVLDNDRVCVLDYKTGSGAAGRDSKYEEQLEMYMTILRGLYPGLSVSGVLAYIDTRSVRYL